MRFLSLLVLLIPWAALADNIPRITYSKGGTTHYVMCDTETDTGICQSGGDEIVLDVNMMANFSFYSTETGAGSYSCDVYTHMNCSDAAAAGCTKLKINSNKPLTSSRPWLGFTALVSQLHISCTNVDGDPFITLILSPVK